MTIQIENILLPFSKMSVEEQMELIAKARHNKYVLKPAIKVRKQKKAKATAKKRVSKVTTQINKLTPAQKLALLKELQNA